MGAVDPVGCLGKVELGLLPLLFLDQLLGELLKTLEHSSLMGGDQKITVRDADCVGLVLLSKKPWSWWALQRN